MGDYHGLLACCAARASAHTIDTSDVNRTSGSDAPQESGDPEELADAWLELLGPAAKSIVLPSSTTSGAGAPADDLAHGVRR